MVGFQASTTVKWERILEHKDLPTTLHTLTVSPHEPHRTRGKSYQDRLQQKAGHDVSANQHHSYSQRLLKWPEKGTPHEH